MPTRNRRKAHTVRLSLRQNPQLILVAPDAPPLLPQDFYSPHPPVLASKHLRNQFRNLDQIGNGINPASPDAYPELFAVFCEEFTIETRRLRREATSAASTRRQELASIMRDLDRLVLAILDGAPARTLNDRIARLEARREELERILADTETAPPVLHPAMAEIYRRKVSDLANALNDAGARAEAAEALRGLVETIELRPEADGYAIFLRGDLAGILQLATAGKKPAALSRDGLSQMALVAG